MSYLPKIVTKYDSFRCITHYKSNYLLFCLLASQYIYDKKFFIVFCHFFRRSISITFS